MGAADLCKSPASPRSYVPSFMFDGYYDRAQLANAGFKVLAAGIVVVFIIGWIKLWWAQRILAKHVLLDEEKRLRQMELRKSGLPAGRKVDIPFGVRAIQSGVQVEGIWISRPVTPLEVLSSSKASSTTLEIERDSKPEDKGKSVVERATATVAEVEPTPIPSPRPSPTSSTFDQSMQPETGVTPTFGPQTAHIQPYPSRRPLASDISPDTVDVNRYFSSITTATKPRGTVPGPFVETYIPTSSSSSINSSMTSRARPVIIDRECNGSDDGRDLPYLRYPIESHGYSRGGRLSATPVATYYRSPFDESDTPPSLTMPSSTVQSFAQGGTGNSSRYCSRVRAETRGNAFENSPESDRIALMNPSFDATHPSVPASSSGAHSRPSLASSRPTPVRTYTTTTATSSADIRENDYQRISTQGRRVNAGFEILPAGTFGPRPMAGEDGGRSSSDSDNTPGIAR
ncbi:hypothetical protein F5Y17DRAFT_411277, partial [Xylariaceae sp. FL0594]